MSDERYVVVTCLSQFRQRYVIPASELQQMTPDVKLEPQTLVDYANDSVTCEDVKEFSQQWLGETIVDTFIVDEPRILHMFNRDNDYLAGWSDEKKLEWIKDWEEDVDGKKAAQKARDTQERLNAAFDTNPWVAQSNLTSTKMQEGNEDDS